MIEVNGDLHDVAIIVLFGPTGVGKSTFANTASGDTMRIGRGLKSCTQEIAPTTMFTVGGKHVTIIDCPGFDDTYTSESEILKTLSTFLAAVYSQNFKISGLLYLHKITDTRIGGTSLRHMNMFKELCGTDSLKNVIYVMNMWSNPPTEDELLRESELRYSDEFFGAPLAEGAQMVRHYNTKESAHNIIRKLIHRPAAVPKVSKQLVDGGLTLEKTGAGAILGLGLQEDISKLDEEIRRLRESHAQTTRQNEEWFELILEEQERKAQDTHQRLEQQVESLDAEHRSNELFWSLQMSDYASALDASFAITMSELLEALGSEHEAMVDSLIGMHGLE